MIKRTTLIATATTLALAAAFPAHARDTNAQTRGSATAQHAAHVSNADLGNWSQAELKSGFSAERLLGMHVRDRSDRSIGEIANILMTRDGRVSAVIVSAGGIIGVGETYYRVAWSQVRFDQRTNSVSVPISKDNVDRFRWGAEEIRMAENELKLREVLEGEVMLRDSTRFGEVDDLIIGRDGRAKALVVTSAGAGTGVNAGRYALPYRGEVFYKEGEKMFTLPYTREDVARLRPLDYDRLGIGGTLGFGAEGRVGSNTRSTERR